MFNLFKVTPAADLIKEVPGGLQGKQKPKPVQAPKGEERFWNDLERRETVFFEITGETANAPEVRESRLTDVDIREIQRYKNLWPKKREAQQRMHDAKALWAKGYDAKQIEQALGMSDSWAQKVTAAFNSAHDANAAI